MLELGAQIHKWAGRLMLTICKEFSFDVELPCLPMICSRNSGFENWFGKPWHGIDLRAACWSVCADDILVPVWPALAKTRPHCRPPVGADGSRQPPRFGSVERDDISFTGLPYLYSAASCVPTFDCLAVIEELPRLRDTWLFNAQCGS